MAANLSVEIGLAGNAVQQAQQITAAFKEMGKAGDSAAQSVAQLQTAASKPIGAPQVNTFTQMVASLEQARQLYADMAAQGAGMAGLGGPMAESFDAAAKAAEEVSVAIKGALEIAKDMIGEGKSMAEVYATLKEQIMGLPTGMEKLGAAGREAFGQIQGMANQTVTQTKEWTNANQQLTKEYSQITQGLEKTAAEVNRATNAVRAQGAELEKAGGHASRMGQNIMFAERGAHDILTTFGLAAGPSAVVGRLARGVDDLLLSVARGGPAMLSFAGGMIAFSVAMKALQAPIDFLKAAFSAGLGQEKLTIQMTGMLGSVSAAHSELEQIKEFVTGGTAGFLSFDDAQKGVERLQNLTGGIMSVAEAERILAGAQAASRQSAEQLGNEIGKVSNYILAGNPIRYMMLATLVESKVITAQNAVELENLSKKGVSGNAIFAQFEQMLHRNDAAAKAASGSFGGLLERLKNITETRILEPIGEALTKGLTPALKQLDTFLDSPAIKAGIESFAYNLEVQLMAAFLLIKDKGFVGAFKLGVDELGKYIADSAPGWGQTLGKALTDFMWQNFKDRLFGDWVQLFQEIKAVWEKLNPVSPPGMISQTGAPLFGAGLTSARGGYPIIPFTQPMTDAEKAQNDAIKQNTQTATRQIETTTKQTETTTTLNATTLTLNNTITKLTAQMVTTMGGIYQPGAGILGAGAGGGALFPGASKGLSEWAPGETPTRATMFGPLGPMKTGDIALSQDKMIELFGSVSNALGKFVDIVDQNGNILLQHQRVWDVSFKAPGQPNVNTFEVWGRTWDQAGKVVLSASNTWDDYVKRAKAMVAPPETKQPSALGGVPQIEKAGAEQKAALKAMDDEIKQVDTDWSLYGKNVKLINEQEKAGIISSTQANQQRLQMDKQIETEITNTIAKLTAQEAAVKKAYPTEDVTKYDDQIKKLHENLDQIHTDEQKIAQLDPWTSFTRGVQQAINSWGNLSTQVENLGKQMTDQIATGMGDAIAGLITGTTKLKDAFKSMATAIIKDITDIIAKQMIMYAWNTMLGLFSSGAGNTALGAMSGAATGVPAGLQSGGLVSGPTGIDKVPSALTAGEYVLTQRAVTKYGLAMIEAMNQGTWLPGPGVSPAGIKQFASGGFVGSATNPNNIPPSQNVHPATSAQNIAIVTNVTVPGTAGVSASPAAVGSTGSPGGITPQNAALLQQSISLVVRDEIVRQKRPGGLLSRQVLGS